MSDMFSILQSKIIKPSAPRVIPDLPYVAVDPALYQGTWEGAYADNTKFTIQISNVTGFRAKVRYQSGSTSSYQDVLIKDNAFRVGDTKFTLTSNGNGA